MIVNTAAATYPEEFSVTGEKMLELILWLNDAKTEKNTWEKNPKAAV